MTNDIFYQRICKFVAITYALDETQVWEAFNKIGSVDKIIDLARSGTLEKAFSINE